MYSDNRVITKTTTIQLREKEIHKGEQTLLKFMLFLQTDRIVRPFLFTDATNAYLSL